MEILPVTYEILSNILPSSLIPYAEEILGLSNVDFDLTTQLLTYILHLLNSLKNGNK
jgi:hypothetical protein